MQHRPLGIAATVEQLKELSGAVELKLDAQALAALNEASRPDA